MTSSRTSERLTLFSLSIFWLFNFLFLCHSILIENPSDSFLRNPILFYLTLSHQKYLVHQWYKFKILYGSLEWYVKLLKSILLCNFPIVLILSKIRLENTFSSMSGDRHFSSIALDLTNCSPCSSVAYICFSTWFSIVFTSFSKVFFLPRRVNKLDCSIILHW